MRLARKVGLNVATVHLRTAMGKDVLLIERFDRVRHGDQWRRRAMVSALTIFELDEMMAAYASYEKLAECIRHRFAHSTASLHELFARMVFNIFVGNDDDHLRNHALLWNVEAGGWGLSPLYDVMPRPTLASERFLHLGIGALGRLATLDNALSAYSRFGLNLHSAEKIVDRIWRVVREWKTWFESYGAPDEQIEKVGSAFIKVIRLFRI